MLTNDIFGNHILKKSRTKKEISCDNCIKDNYKECLDKIYEKNIDDLEKLIKNKLDNASVEIYLHPLLQKDMGTILLEISQLNQVIFTTNSPLLLKNFEIEDIKKYVRAHELFGEFGGKLKYGTSEYVEFSNEDNFSEIIYFLDMADYFKYKKKNLSLEVSAE